MKQKHYIHQVLQVAAVNGELDEAKTTGIIGNNKLNIEPRNISAVYIIK